MDIDDDFIKQLAELGFIAGGYGMLDQADAIVGALETLRPGSERPALIAAVTRLSLQDAPGAEQVLRERALKPNPNSGMVKAYLGLALHLQGRVNERDQILHEALALADDEDAMTMARNLLNTRPG